MTNHEDGVADLLERATHDLAPDTARLIAGGAARGRSLRRRQRAGTAVAAVAVLGVIGAAALAVPHLGGSASLPLAGKSTAHAPTTPKQHRTTTRDLAVPAADIPATAASLWTGGELGKTLTHPTFPLVNESNERIVHFLWDGTLTTLVIDRGPNECSGQSAPDSCAQLPNGRGWSSSGEDTADQVTARYVTVFTSDGYRVSVLSYNAPVGKDVPPTMAEPPLSFAQLTAAASSEVWFE